VWSSGVATEETVLSEPRRSKGFWKTVAEDAGGSPPGIPASILAVGVGVLGIVMAHYPMFRSGMRRVQTDLVDTRFNN
jgi:hypothetical protein